MLEECPRKQRFKLNEIPKTILNYKIKFNAKNIDENLS